MTEVILSALASDLSVIDGMDRTMMVAAEATCATAVMPPLWNVFKPDVNYRTLLGATATVNTHIAVNGELLVSYHKTVEIGTDAWLNVKGVSPCFSWL